MTKADTNNVDLAIKVSVNGIDEVNDLTNALNRLAIAATNAAIALDLLAGDDDDEEIEDEDDEDAEAFAAAFDDYLKSVLGRAR